MANQKRIVFHPFYLDLASELLWKGSESIKLTPKAFALLTHLLERPGQLVTKDALLEAIWPGTFVSDAVLKVTIRQIREALGDDSKSPRFIETAHRRGYRFVGRITDGSNIPSADQQTMPHSTISDLTLSPADSSSIVVGRDETLSQLQECFGRMIAGERQIVFITGEAGIGKTAVVDAFARSLVNSNDIRVGRGQCLEQYGTGEAYLPVLDAVGRLAREHPHVVDMLRAHAPMWLMQMPSLVSIPDREMLHREMFGATRERMLREMGEALEILTTELPLVLILEDLHWSDYSTLDLISFLARQRQRAHLMLIGTYRTAELITSGHPLTAVKQELLSKHQCEELPLEYLSEAGVADYLLLRFPVNRFPKELAQLIHERTEGNPLFIVNMVDYLVAEGLISEVDEHWELTGETERVQVGVPNSIKQIVERQLDRLDDQQRQALEVASVAGPEFSTFAVAGLESNRAAVEGLFDELVRQNQFIQDAGVQLLPNGEAVTKYSFIHDLYRTGLYEMVSASRRLRLHRRLGDELEAIYGERSKEIAAELAMHFELGADPKRGANYLQQAADNAIRRFAYREAVALSRRGLKLVGKLPESRERAEQELSLQLTLGLPLIALEGYAAAAVGSVYLRARQLCQQLGETPDLSKVLWGLWTFHTLRAELRTALDMAEELLRLARQPSYSELAMRGHWATEITLTHLGEFSLAVQHYEKALVLYDPKQHLDDGFLYALNPGVAMPCFAAWSHWFLGEPDQSLQRIEQALKSARELSEPLGLAHALLFAAVLYQLRREEQLAQKHADAAFAISTEHGLALYRAMAMVIIGWTQIKQLRHSEAIDQIRDGLAALQATGTELVRPHFLGLLAEALTKASQFKEALSALDEALTVANRGGEKYYEAELYRLKGEIFMPASDPVSFQGITGKKSVTVAESNLSAQIEAWFNRSISIAREQKARSLELRAAMSMTRLYDNQGKQQEARTLLADVYGKFTEGFDTTDLREAKELLNQLSGSANFAK